MELRIIEGIAELPAERWDSLVNPNDPFLTHAFLSALEESGSVGRGSGWQPVHLLAEKENELIAAAPLYLKTDSYGEYIFDWGWAEASERAGIPYYPKLVCAIPFTPATCRRLLMKSPDPELKKIMWKGIQATARATDAMSTHILFLEEDEHSLLSAEKGAIGRIGMQFHWENPGVNNFDEWIGLFRSKDRKKIRRERSKAQASVDCIRHIKGTELSENDIERIWNFYVDTSTRKWGRPYLHRAFFEKLSGLLSDLALVFVAEKENEIVAMALTFQRGEHLYGRYWGCRQSYDCLHFELCYHQPIDMCITNGWSRFEAGAQGQHKIKRGLMPQPIYSVHWLRHPGLAEAVRDAVIDESAQVKRGISALSQHGPFRRGC